MLDRYRNRFRNFLVLTSVQECCASSVHERKRSVTTGRATRPHRRCGALTGDPWQPHRPAGDRRAGGRPSRLLLRAGRWSSPAVRRVQGGAADRGGRVLEGNEVRQVAAGVSGDHLDLERGAVGEAGDQPIERRRARCDAQPSTPHQSSTKPPSTLAVGTSDVRSSHSSAAWPFAPEAP